MTNRGQCINKANRTNPHERILNIGDINADGTRWKTWQQDAIQRIEDGRNTFEVSAAGRTIRVTVATHNGNKYIKTENDGMQPDNLLSLPECA